MNILFYFYYIAIQIIGGGSVYATGEYRKPLSDSEFTREAQEVKWVIAGQDSLSSCYAWAMADTGCEFAGFYADSAATQLLTAESEQARIWAVTDSAKTENGIVSGNNFYPAIPTDTIYAIFRNPSIPTGVEDAKVQNCETAKLLKNGEVEIRKGECRYTILGRRK